MEHTKLAKAASKKVLVKMKLVAEILTGSLFYIEVQDNASIGNLKTEIGRQENLPSDRLILLLDGANEGEHRLMDKDEASLKDYGVEDSSHIYIFFQAVHAIASAASPSTPKESASSEPSHSMDSSSAPASNRDLDQENPSREANEPSASVDQEDEC